MNTFFAKSIIIICSLIFLNLQARVTTSGGTQYNQTTDNVWVDDSIPPEEVQSLDLTHIRGKDYEMGLSYDETELENEILSHPNLIELNLTGQILTQNLMTMIHDHLPKLKKLVMRGYTVSDFSHGRWYSGYYLDPHFRQILKPIEISEDMLKTLFLNGSSIEFLDLSLSTVTDKGLEQIAHGSSNLKEINLKGDSAITDEGVLQLVGKVPSLKVVDISNLSLAQPNDASITIGPQVSQSTRDYLSNKGIRAEDFSNLSPSYDLEGADGSY